MNNSPLAVARACLQVYVDKNRAALEALVAADYYFTSPIDNALDRETYFSICWPNSEATAKFDFVCGSEKDDRAFIVYEGHTASGKVFRNCEVHTVREGKLVATEVSLRLGRTAYGAAGTTRRQQGTRTRLKKRFPPYVTEVA